MPDATPFDRYAHFYDLLYRDKDYAAEARFVHQRLAAAGAGGGHLLELGSGSGRHAIELARLGWSVTGYDRSPGMVGAANRRVERDRDAASRVLFSIGD